MKKETRYILVNPGTIEADLLGGLIDYGFEKLSEAKAAGNFGGKHTIVSGLMKVTVTVEEVVE